jgi:hypothetical protein
VEDKVPRAGYVLIKPDTPEGHRLRTCWLTADRPERFIVPYTFVEICELRGMLLNQIFVHEGRPMGIHIHRSIANVIVRENIAASISVRKFHLISTVKHLSNHANSIPVVTRTCQRSRRALYWPIARHQHLCNLSRIMRVPPGNM